VYRTATHLHLRHRNEQTPGRKAKLTSSNTAASSGKPWGKAFSQQTFWIIKVSTIGFVDKCQSISNAVIKSIDLHLDTLSLFFLRIAGYLNFPFITSLLRSIDDG
jgi:hypothetical protein